MTEELAFHLERRAETAAIAALALGIGANTAVSS